MKCLLSISAAVSFVFAGTATIVSAADNFYAAKSIDVIIGSAPGGSYDLYARLITRNMGKHIPGKPTFVARNMPGAGGVTATNYLYNHAPKDGSVIGSVRQELALEQVLGNKSVQYDAVKFRFIGRTNVNVPVHVVRGDVAIKSIEDVKKAAVITGADSPRSLPATYPRALNRIVGTQWKIVAGYKGGAAVRLALEKGEVQAAVGPAVLYKNRLKKWLVDGVVRPIVQYSSFRYELFPDVPTMVELAQNDDDKKVLELIASTATVGRSFVAPPGVPEQRLAVLRKAFASMMKDEAFLAETKKRSIDIQPATGEEILKIMEETLAASPQTVARAKEALRPEGK